MDLMQSRTVRLGQVTLRFNMVVAASIVLACSLFVRLGIWQLDRAAEKRQAEQTRAERLQAEPVPLASLSGPSPPEYTRVTLEGEYLQQEVAFLRLYQFHQGQPGYEVLSPFRPASGGDMLLVSRGWMAPGEEGERPPIPDVEGEQRLVARVHHSDVTSQRGQISDEDWPVRLPRLNLTQAGELLGEPLRPYIVRLEADQPGVLTRHWSAPDFSTRTHYVYAAQWFGFTLIVLVATAYFATNLFPRRR